MAVVIKPLSKLKFTGQHRSTMNVCVVSSEILGPVKNGGIGTATSGLLKQLVSDGNRVTLLYTLVENNKPASGDKTWQEWVDANRSDGITLEHIPHKGDYRSWREKSWHVKEFIGHSDFALVYFNDHHGSGYYSLLAKRAGMTPFAEQLHCVITHGGIEWVFDINDQYMRRPADLEMIGLERRSVEMADVVIGPSKYLLEQYEKYGWQLPAQTFQQPYPLFTAPAPASDKRPIPIDELVFFGRLEVRKGLWLFCEALDQLGEQLRGKTVTFLGRETSDSTGLSSGLQIVNRTANWPCRVELITDLDQAEALAYLSKAGRLAIMPSLADNSPCVIYECMEAGIPFVSTLGSGAEELIDPDSRSDVMVQPVAHALAKKLQQILKSGTRMGKPLFTPQDNLATWSAWHRHVADNRASLIRQPSVTSIVAARAGSRTRAKTPKIPLIVVIDNGRCTLSLLIDNLRAHAASLGKYAAFLIISSRPVELQGLLFEALEGLPDFLPGSICISDARAIGEALQLILASDVVFCVDAETEIQTPFFILANNILRQQQPAVVSCATAVRNGRKGIPQLEELPSGYLPGFSGLGDPVGGAVVAMSVKGLKDELCALEFFDKKNGMLISVSALSEELLRRCHRAGVPIHVLPVAGAIETRQAGQPQYVPKFRQIKDAARLLDIKPSVFAGSAPWFAISAFGAHHSRIAAPPIECSQFLPPEHPLIGIQAKQDGIDLAEFAAALGRPELALQIQAGSAPTTDKVRSLTALATNSVRLRTGIDLAKILQAGKAIEFGRRQMPEKGKTGKASSRRGVETDASTSLDGLGSRAAEQFVQSQASDDVTRVYLDALRLQLIRNKIRARTKLSAEEPGKLFFFDVPLCGNGHFEAELSSLEANSPSVRVTMIDQRSGGEIGQASMRFDSAKTQKISIPLYGIYAWATVAFEFSNAKKMEVTVEAASIQ